VSFPGPPEADALVGVPIIVVLDVFVKVLLYLLLKATRKNLFRTVRRSRSQTPSLWSTLDRLLYLKVLSANTLIPTGPEIKDMPQNLTPCPDKILYIIQVSDS